MVKPDISKLRGTLSTLEVDKVGVARLQDWKGAELEESALRLLPGARSVVVVATEVFREVLYHVTPGGSVEETPLRGMLDAHREYLNMRMNEGIYEVARASHRLGFKALPLPSVGMPLHSRHLTPYLSYKYAAQAAGLGGFGKSTLIVTREFGPRVRFACCLTEAELEPTPVSQPHKCGKCQLCIEGCPVKAIAPVEGSDRYRVERFMCNTFRAGSYCSECMRLCPAGR